MGISSQALSASVVECTTAQASDSVARLSPAELIEVRAPYCSLQEIEASQPGRVSARVWPEQVVDLEEGEIAAAEAGRHLAILGSIACASYSFDPKRRYYYLAERAVLRTPDELPRTRSHRQLRLSAEHLHSNAREALAECQMLDAEGHVLYGLNVTYKLVPEKIFQRLFAGFRVDLRRGGPRSPQPLSDSTLRRLRQNPYQRRLELSIAEVSEQQVRAELPSIPPAACAGHFAQYPALPVAVLMEAFSNVGGALLRKRLGAPDLRYRVRSAEIVASKLVFAGQPLSIHGTVLDDLPSAAVKMRLQACLASGEEVASTTTIMQGTTRAANL
jgi:3-hydroxymyristoyl/3-hydroxydecanoyl-(acyl carrier protein) dehydratase